MFVISSQLNIHQNWQRQNKRGDNSTAKQETSNNDITIDCMDTTYLSSNKTASFGSVLHPVSSLSSRQRVKACPKLILVRSLAQLLSFSFPHFLRLLWFLGRLRHDENTKIRASYLLVAEHCWCWCVTWCHNARSGLRRGCRTRKPKAPYTLPDEGSFVVPLFHLAVLYVRHKGLGRG